MKLLVLLALYFVAAEGKKKLACGRVTYHKAANDGWRVLNGRESTGTQWPWLVHLYVDGYVCGATLLDKYTVISAAHCGKRAEMDPSRMMIAIGSTEWRGVPTYHYFMASKVILHEEYDVNEEPPAHDIMMVKLNRPADEWAPICLPKPGAVFQNENCYVAGWGKTETERTSDKLQHARVPVISNRECSFYQGEEIKSYHVCAGGKGTNACQGDSGGPLMCRDPETREWVLAGIVSWGDEECKRDGYPTVFTRVTSFLDWIENNRN